MWSINLKLQEKWEDFQFTFRSHLILWKDDTDTVPITILDVDGYPGYDVTTASDQMDT